MRRPEHSSSPMDEGRNPLPMTRLWYDDHNLHRRHGPAVEMPNGRKQWMVHGAPHRSDGPAVEAPSGEFGWYLRGQFHILSIPGVDPLYAKMEMERLGLEDDLLPGILGLATHLGSRRRGLS